MGENKVLLFLLALVVLASSAPSQKKLYYLHQEDTLQESAALSEIINNPYGIPVLLINCKQKQCQKYKAPLTYPQLVFWNGPGCSYKTMQQPTLGALNSHIQKVQSNPIRPLKDFLEGISLAEAFYVAFALGGFLFFVFTKLFTPKLSDKVKPQ